MDKRQLKNALLDWLTDMEDEVIPTNLTHTDMQLSYSLFLTYISMWCIIMERMPAFPPLVKQLQPELKKVFYMSILGGKNSISINIFCTDAADYLPLLLFSTTFDKYRLLS